MQPSLLRQNLNDILNGKFIFTKRLLGLGVVLLGALAFVGLVGLDIVRNRGLNLANLNYGPMQLLGMGGSVGLVILGLTLFPLKDQTVVALTPRDQPLPQPTKIRWLALAQRALLILSVALMVAHFLIYAHFALSLLSFPFDYDQGEGFELNDTVLFSHGQLPYQSDEVFPFYSSNYPPLFHLILVPFAWLFGPQYWYGRLMGFLATLVTAGLIGYAIQRETKHRGAALLGGLAYLASNYVYHIGPLFRQHISMVMFETLAVVLVAGVAGIEDPRLRRRRLLLTMICLLAAGYTKQLAIATVAAVFVYLFFAQIRRAVIWAIGLAIVAGGLFVLLNVVTHGQWWLNTITANVNQFITGQFTGLFSQFVGLHGALLIMAGALLIYELYFDHLSVYSIWFGAALVNSVLAGKWGAGDSYFATAIAAACLLAGIFTGRTLNRLWRFPPAFSVRMARWLDQLGLGLWIGRLGQTLTPIIGLACLAAFLAYGLAVIKMPLEGPIFGPVAKSLNFIASAIRSGESSTGLFKRIDDAILEPIANALTVRPNTKFSYFYDSAGWTMGYATIGHIPSAQDVENGWRIVALVKDDPRPILSEEAAFSFLTGKPVVTNPTQLLNLYDNKAYDPTTLVDAINQQTFGAVIFRARFYPQPVLDAIDAHYQIVEKIPMNGYEYTILKPKP